MLERHLAAAGLSIDALSVLAAERFGLAAASHERRLRTIRAAGPGDITDVHTADRYLVLVWGHLADLEAYRAAVMGEIPPEDWPRRRSGRGGPRPAGEG